MGMTVKGKGTAKAFIDEDSGAITHISSPSSPAPRRSARTATAATQQSIAALLPYRFSYMPVYERAAGGAASTRDS